MAILKHIAVKNSNYGQMQRYLLFQHDSHTQKPIPDENGDMLLREGYLMDALNCDPFTFNTECTELNRLWHKNLGKNDRKAHHYIISFDPRDVPEHGLTPEKVQAIGMEFAKYYFAGHQTLIVTHTDGHNHSGNLHCHIVLNSLRKLDVPWQDFMEEPIDAKAGFKHHPTDKLIMQMYHHLQSICEREHLHTVDLSLPADRRITDVEYRKKQRGQQKMDERNRKIREDGYQPIHTKYETIKDQLRQAVDKAVEVARDEQDFIRIMQEQHGISVRFSRGVISYKHPDRDKPIRGRQLGRIYEREQIAERIVGVQQRQEEERSRPEFQGMPRIFFIHSELRLVVDLQTCVKAQQSRAYARKVALSNLQEMARTIAYRRGAWVLERGDYEISLRADAHTVIDSQTYSVTADVVYDASNPHNGDVQPANNKFDFAEGSVNYLSRRDAFANYEQAVAAPSDFTLTTTLYANGSYDPAEHNDASDTMPTTGAKNGMQLLELRGADYDDPRWETLLDQVTVAEMVDLIAYGGHQTASVNSVGKLRTMDTDGPAGVNSSTLGFFGTGFCSEILIAQTWNEDLAYAASEAMAKEFRDFGVVGWYAPSMNMHRSAFGGRNFEYYSEDSLLSARMGVQETAACVENGMYPYIKHFALNEQETNRNGMLCTWLTEQSMRELYLRPFEECVKYAPSGKIAIMSSYNYIGSQWAGACRALQTEVLRGEWGFEGFVLSDYFGNYGYMDADRAIRGGTDVMLGTAGNEAILTDQTSATSIKAMRQATKNVFFTTVNSEAFADMASGVTPGWLRTTHIIDGVLAAVLILCEILLIRGFLKKRKRA